MPEPTKIIVVELTPDTAEVLGAALLAQQDDIVARLEREMTVDQAKAVRLLRVDCGYTWGAIGQRWASAHEGQGWVGGQVLGRALCHRAAELLSENPHEEPWN